MTCIEKIYSVSALIGNGACNGKCSFCAGKYLRKQAANQSPLHWKNLASAIKLSARYGGWSLSLTSSGEPTCDPESVTKALTVYKECADQGAYFPNVNLFTNGILFGDPEFCATWLPHWRDLGLTNVAVSIHGIGEKAQDIAYGLHAHDYPPLDRIVNNIRAHGVGVRGTLLLRKNEVDNASKYVEAVNWLRSVGLDNITSWPVGNPDGSRNQYTPSILGLLGIRYWLWRNAVPCHAHQWGGGVYDHNGMMLRLTDYVTRHDPGANFVRQLVVFQDGTTAYSWIRHGALCMK